MRPYFSRCVDNFFTGFDPPRTLAPAAALAPSTTSTSSVAFTTAPKPSPTPHVGAKKTANSKSPIITPSEIPTVGQPRKQDIQAPDPKSNPKPDPKLDPKSDPKPDPKHQTSNSGKEVHNLAPPKTHPAQPGSKSEEINGDSQKEEKAKTVPGEGKNPIPPFISVPTIAAGITKAGSDQNADPAVHGILPLVGSANPMDVKPTDSHSQVQPGDPQHINDAAETVENHPSKVQPLPGIQVDPEKNAPSESSPADKTEGGFGNENPDKFDQSTKATEDPKNSDTSSNKVPGKSNPADESTDESRNENPSSTEPSAASELDPTKEPGTENPNRPHSSDVTGDTRKKNPSNIDPSIKVMSGSKIENPNEVNLPVKGAQDPSMEMKIFLCD